MPHLDSFRHVLPTKEYVPVSLIAAFGERTGPASDGVILGAFTLADCMCSQADAAVHTDYTTEGAEATTDDVVTFPATPADTDAFYISSLLPFSGVKIKYTTAGVGTVTNVEWQYWNGSAWSPLTTVDDTALLITAAGTHFVTFEPPSDWVKRAAPDLGIWPTLSVYAIRLACTAAAQYNTTVPLLDQLWLLQHEDTTGIEIPFDCTVTAIECLAETNAGAAADSEFLLVNGSAEAAAAGRSFQPFTWPQGEYCHRVYVGGSTTEAWTALRCKKGDQLLIQQVVHDGTNEITNAFITLELTQEV